MAQISEDFVVVAKKKTKSKTTGPIINTELTMINSLDISKHVLTKPASAPTTGPKPTKTNKEIERLLQCREDGSRFVCAILLQIDKQLFRNVLGLTTDHDERQTVRTGSAAGTDAAYRTIVGHNCYNKISFIIGACQTCTKNENHILLNLLILYLINNFGMTKIEILESSYGEDGYTMLNAACWNLSKECMIYCIANGANVNFRNKRNEGIREVLKCGLDHANKGATSHLGQKNKSSTAKMFKQINQTKYRACIQYLDEREEHMQMMKRMEELEISERSIKKAGDEAFIEIIDDLPLEISLDDLPKEPMLDSIPAEIFDEGIHLTPLSVPKGMPDRPLKGNTAPEFGSALDSVSLNLGTTFSEFVLYKNDAPGNKYVLECIDKLIEMYANEDTPQNIQVAKVGFKETMNGELCEKFDRLCDNEEL